MADTSAGASVRDNSRPVWAASEIRLDPYALPQRVSYDRRAIGDDTGVDIVVDARGAVMKRRLDCGLPVSMALPARAFKGIAARAFENEDGSTTITLELLHFDSQLSVPLMVTDSPEEAAADWHSWSRNLRLPMLMVNSAGETELVKSAEDILIGIPAPRRRKHLTLKHRPNFLRRRKVGVVGEVTVLTADEIIARN